MSVNVDNVMVFKKRAAAVVAVAAQKYLGPKLYRPAGGFPAIEFVPGSGVVPDHGVFHGPGGDIVVNMGDWIVADGRGGYAPYAWYNFHEKYEENA